MVRLLAQTGGGARALRRRLPEEKNPAVLGALCAALAAMGDRDSVPAIERLAENHPLQSVRRDALKAIADLLGWESVPYLRRRLNSERSPAVRAVVSCLLFITGSDEGIPLIRRTLASRDARIKRLVADTLAHYSPRRRRQLVIRTLEESLAGETREAVVADIERAIGEISRNRRAIAAGGARRSG
jgi:HEAT repeat protein